MMILMVLSVFRTNDRMQNYGSLKFWQTRFREKFITFLFLNQIEWFFYFIDLEQENKVKIKIKFLEINFGGKKIIRSYPIYPYYLYA